MEPFLQLDDYLLPAPLPACIALCMCLGFRYLGNFFVRALRHSFLEPVESAAGFILMTGVVAVLVNLLAFLGLAYLWPLRILAWGLAILGLVDLLRCGPDCLIAMLRRALSFFQRQSRLGKTAVLLIFITGVSLFLAALGPPTDADSLDYHLGIPLDILRHHQAFPHLDWLHARVVGLGESLNMLGLAGGTDTLGAALQFFGLASILASFLSLVKSDFDRILTAMLVLGCPLMLFLIPNQKPQMLPVAATSIALTMIVRRFRSIDPVTMVLAFGGAFFAMSCKYSFILSGSIVVGTGLIAAHKSKRLDIALWITLAGLLIFFFPICLQKHLFYGDPISPLLERFFTHGQVSVIAFANYLKSYRDSSITFPLSLILPGSLGTVSTILGMGSFLVFAAPRVRGYSVIFIVCALIASFLTFFLGQVTSRFYLEPYFWIIAAVLTTPSFKVNPLFFKMMLAQMVFVAAMATMGAVILFPGAWTPALRHKVMLKCAYQYGESKWLDGFLPKNAVILTDLRSKALCPRKFVSSEIYASFDAMDIMAEEKITSQLKQRGASVWVTFDGGESRPYLAKHFPVLLGKSQPFRIATRNPWNASSSSRIAVYGSKR